MLNALRLIAAEQFLLLRRDKIFLPAVLVAAGVSALANAASDWSVEDYEKILYDIGYFGFFFTGSVVALFWGTKSVNDSRQEGSIELELAAPVSRTAWLLGKYLGLATCLVSFAALLLVIWQTLAYVNGFGWMKPAQLVMFAYMVLSWLVAAALAVCCASFLRQTVALFVSVCLWLVGQAVSLVAHTMAPETPAFTKGVVGGMARVWDLQQFNLVDQVLKERWTDMAELGYRGAYGALLILSLMTLACLIFQRRDVIG